MPGRKGRSGGRRANPGGRPRKPKAPPASRELPWFEIREAAAAGATEVEVVKAFGITEADLADQAALALFRKAMEVGYARFKIELRKTIRERSLRTRRGAGSVNAQALQAREHLGYDSQKPAQETEPDLGTARQRLEDLGEKLAGAASEREGKTVTLAMLLQREVRAVEKAARGDA
jgi:hypothetical protein